MKRTWKYNMLYLKMVKENDYIKERYIWNGRKWNKKRDILFAGINVQFDVALNMMRASSLKVSEASNSLHAIHNKRLMVDIHKGE